uniref:Uncharacterized protein n=1 Tax=Cucumis melo TaxID=3656 RepID=A0A9I9EHC4_CUCME
MLVSNFYGRNDTDLHLTNLVPCCLDILKLILVMQLPFRKSLKIHGNLRESATAMLAYHPRGEDFDKDCMIKVMNSKTKSIYFITVWICRLS